MHIRLGALPARRDDRAERLRVLFVVNTDWFFLSHRLPIARAARDAGAEVFVAAPDTGSGQEIERQGFRFLALPLSRQGINPIQDIRLLARWLRMYWRLRPHLVHHVTIKPVLYGSLLARLVPGISIVNAVSGLGHVFSSHRTAGVVRLLVVALYRLALRHPRGVTVFQNPDDQEFMLTSGLVRREQAILIRGSGVNCSQFQPTPEPNGPAVVMLPSRMLLDKGIVEFIEAARQLRAAHPGTRFVLVGKPDSGARTTVSGPQLEAWARDGMVEWWGHRTDMPAVLRQAAIVVLPTWYPEGVPKVLLEAAAAGRPIVATDTPGCREIVRPGVNGILVPPRDSAALAQAIQTLLADADLRQRLGRAGRRIALTEFSEQTVVERTLAVYRTLLDVRLARLAPPQVVSPLAADASVS